VIDARMPRETDPKKNRDLALRRAEYGPHGGSAVPQREMPAAAKIAGDKTFLEVKALLVRPEGFEPPTPDS
jgi:hypothetical protein